MKSKWTITGIIVAVALLALAVGLTRAQGPEPPEEGVQPEGGVGIEAAVLNVIPIQGRLTDASGTPLNGTYSITATLYTAYSGGTAVCADNDNVAVSNGLFRMEMDFCDSNDINGQQLYLGIRVGSNAEMTPRQPIYPVPYAFSLRPGAIISGSNNVLMVYGDTDTYATLYARDLSPNGGYGVYGLTNSSEGYGVAGFQTGYSASDNTYWESGGLFGGRNGVIGISKEPGGFGVIGWNRATTDTYSIGVYGRTNSPIGWAGYFYTGAGNGVYITAPSGKTGLNVASGTKNAVVRTGSGSRLLYTEESTEVWFTDYGFGKLQDGVAVITIDPIFAQTVNLNEPYHVFVQPYGDASLYVTNRTPTGFEVRLHDGDPDVEFSYRIVAKRLGYEGTRLERAPWADNDPNLYPEKRTTWEAQQPGGAP